MFAFSYTTDLNLTDLFLCYAPQPTYRLFLSFDMYKRRICGSSRRTLKNNKLKTITVNSVDFIHYRNGGTAERNEIIFECG